MLNDKIRCGDAYWVQRLKYNLLSISQLNNIGHKIEFQNDKGKIYDGNKNLICTGEQTIGNLFHLNHTICTCQFAKVEDVQLWHKRLSHVNFKNMVKYVERGE